MLTKRQNLLETIRGGNPDRFVKQYEAFAMQIPNGFSIHNPSPKPGQMNVVNAWGVTRSWPAGMPGAFPVHTPDKIVIKDIENWREYLKVPQVKYDAQVWEPFIAAAEAVDRNEYFVTSAVFPGIFEQCHYLTEIQNCLMAFYEYPDEMQEIIDEITNFEMELAEEICKYIKPDALFHHDDWGSQISTFLSPAMFREFIKPYYVELWGLCREHDVDSWLHTCGNISEIIGDLIECGLSVLHPLQKGTMDWDAVAAKWKGKIAFLVGMDVQDTLINGTPDDVRREVRLIRDTFDTPGGGLLYAAGNGIVRGTPLENIDAFLDECLTYGNS